VRQQALSELDKSHNGIMNCSDSYIILTQDPVPRQCRLFFWQVVLVAACTMMHTGSKIGLLQAAPERYPFVNSQCPANPQIARACARAHALIHTHKFTHTHTCTHTYMRKHTHTHTHTQNVKRVHTLSLPPFSLMHQHLPPHAYTHTHTTNSPFESRVAIFCRRALADV